MAWHLISSTIILLTVIISFISIVITLIYYKKIIQPNQSLSLWKIRRPMLFLCTVLASLIADGIKCITLLLLDIGIINESIYFPISSILVFYGAVMFISIRVWLLLYDLKTARKEQTRLLAKRLTTDTYNINPFDENNIIPSKKHKFGSYTYILYRVLIFVTLFAAVTIILDVIGYRRLSKAAFLGGYAAITLIFYTYCLFSVRCSGCTCTTMCNKNASETQMQYRDDWLLLLELTLLWCIWLVAAVAGFLMRPLTNNITNFNPYVYNSLFTTIARVMDAGISLIIPYIVLKKTNYKDLYVRADVKTLRKVLSRRLSFFYFLEHLVQEFSMENLLFLVEVWQFKYHKESDLIAMLKIKINSAPNDEAKTDSPDTLELPTITTSIPKSPTSLSETFGAEPSESSHTPTWTEAKLNQAFDQNSKMSLDFLEKLLWKTLPLAESIDSNHNDKWNQCNAIFGKFIDANAYNTINISYIATDEINYNYALLSKYRLQEKRSPDAKVTKNSDENMIANDIMESDLISNDEEFNKKLIGLFDAALYDIIQNLMNSLSRFVRTEQFKLTIPKK